MSFVAKSNSESLKFTILRKCKVTKARTSLMKLPNFEVELPMFMPVGTQGTMKGLTPNQVVEAGAQLILGNTYHLGTRPGKEVFDKYGSLHNFMQWKRALLTDSGGFQMVSLLKLAEITEEGVKFQSPYDGSECMLTPEESISIQNAIGADIMMQLDDVVDVKETEYERFKLATERTTRWYDRCAKANQNPHRQNLFAIVQGGLFPDLRLQSLKELVERDAPGYAIGGLSGGEDKNKFCSTVDFCTDSLPELKPRYCMGVGFQVDLVVCCALGVDMFDCVYPTRTARFGCALVDGGQINLKNPNYKYDFTPIDPKCGCSTCQNYTKAYIKTLVNKETISCHLISVHNIYYLMELLKAIRESIKEDRFVSFVKDFMKRYYKDQSYPQWVVDALKAVNISLTEKGDSCEKERDFEWDEDEYENSYLERVSGFQKSNYTLGFREGIFKDYDGVEDGRIEGYTNAWRSSNIDRNFEKGASNCDSVSGNLTWVLSQWAGVLLACLSMHIDDISLERKKEVTDLSSKIDLLVKRFSSLDEESISEFFISNNPSLFQNSNLSEESRLCIEECRKICKALNFKIPSHLSI